MIAAFLIFEAQGSLGGGLYQGYNWENWKGRVWKFKRTLIQKLNACKFAQRGLGGGDCWSFQLIDAKGWSGCNHEGSRSKKYNFLCACICSYDTSEKISTYEVSCLAIAQIYELFSVN